MKSLYRAHVLDHYRQPRNYGTLEEADVSAELDNPVCGDAVRFDLQLEEGRVTQARFSGQGCILSMAAASMLTEEVVGQTVADLMAWQKEDVFALLGITLGPARAKCALLPLRALQDGLARLEGA